MTKEDAEFKVTPEQAALVERRIRPLLKDAAYGARPLRQVIANAYVLGMADAAGVVDIPRTDAQGGPID